MGMKAPFVLAIFFTIFSTAARASDFAALYEEAMVSFDKSEKDPDSPIAREYALVCSEKAVAAYRAAGTEIERYSALVLQSRCLGFLSRRVKRAVAGG